MKKITTILMSAFALFAMHSCELIEDEKDKVDINSNLYARFLFEDDLKNQTSNSVNASFINGTANYVEGVKSQTKAIKFTRTQQDYVNIIDPMIDVEQWTVSFWAKKMADGNVFYVIDDTGNPCLSLSLDNGFLKFITTSYNVKYNYAELSSFTHSSLTDDNWHHVTLTSDYVAYVANIILYLNGKKVDAITERFSGSEIPFGKGMKFICGGAMESINLNATNMCMDNLRVYSGRCLSAKDIKKIYDIEKP